MVALLDTPQGDCPYFGNLCLDDFSENSIVYKKMRTMDSVRYYTNVFFLMLS